MMRQRGSQIPHGKLREGACTCACAFHAAFSERAVAGRGCHRAASDVSRAPDESTLDGDAPAAVYSETRRDGRQDGRLTTESGHAAQWTSTQSLLGVAIGRSGRQRRIQYEQKCFRHLHGSKTRETSGRGAGARAASIRARRSLGSFRRSGDRHLQPAPSALPYRNHLAKTGLMVDFLLFSMVRGDENGSLLLDGHRFAMDSLSASLSAGFCGAAGLVVLLRITVMHVTSYQNDREGRRGSRGRCCALRP